MNKLKLTGVLFAVLSLPLVATTSLAHKHKDHPNMMKRMKFIKPIMVNKGQKEISFTLPSNATTGYSWYLMKYDHELLEPEKAEYVPPTSQLAGAPGKMVWTFEVDEDAFMVPQVTRIALVYARPWDMKDASVTIVPVVFK